MQTELTYTYYSDFVGNVLADWNVHLDATDEIFNISFSGGKDSTCLLVLTGLLIKQGHSPSRFRVTTADTLMETPAMVKQILLAEKFSLQLGVQFETVSAPVDKRFFAEMIGRGIAPPNRSFRWCTDRLKISPINKNKIGKTVTGVRFGESSSRDVRLNKIKSNTCNGGNECGSQSTPDVYTPIVAWKSCNVWDFLAEALANGGIDEGLYTGLVDLYATNGTINESLRTGCMGCPLVSKDKSLEAFVLSESGGGYEPLIDLHAMYKELAKECNRVYRPDRVSCKGRKGGGKYTLGAIRLSVRKQCYAELLLLEAKVKARHPDFVLISAEEKALIQSYHDSNTYPKNYPKGFNECSQDNIRDEISLLKR